jgi:fructan beta-fructosidase
VVLDQNNSSGFGDDAAPVLVAIYTGCLRRPEGGQAQDLANSLDRGRSWTKYANNPVLDLGLRDFRDPKVFWHEPTQRWIMLVVLAHERRAQLYGSPDLKTWLLLSEFESPFADQGIWECPDLIPLRVSAEESVWLFKVDVLAGHPSGGSGARIFFGQFDGKHFIAEPEVAPRWADEGADFYAALSWANLPQGRQVWLAWMNCHRYAKHLPTHPWRGAITVPRELSARRTAQGWQLLQVPVAELAQLRGAGSVHAALCLTHGEQALPWANVQRCLDIELSIVSSTAHECGLALRFGGGAVTRIGFCAARQAVFVDRSAAGFNPPDDEFFAQRCYVACAAPAADKPLRLRVLLDWSSVEVFVGDGEATLTLQIFPQAERCAVALYAEGSSTDFGEIRIWPLQPANFEVGSLFSRSIA